MFEKKIDVTQNNYFVIHFLVSLLVLSLFFLPQSFPVIRMSFAKNFQTLSCFEIVQQTLFLVLL